MEPCLNIFLAAPDAILQFICHLALVMTESKIG